MSKIDEIKKYQGYLDILEKDFNVSGCNDFQDDIEDYDKGSLSDEDIEEAHKDLDSIELEFPDEPDCLYYSLEEFDRYMREIDSIEEVDNTTVRTKHIRQTIIDATRHGWEDFNEKIQSFNFVGEGYKVAIISEPFLIGIVNAKNKNYDEDCGIYPCSHYFALELVYEGDKTLKPEEEDRLFERILYYLSQRVRCAIYVSEVVDVYSLAEDLEEDREELESETIDVKTLTTFTPLTRLYSQALQAEDPEIRFLYFYKIIEHISPMVAKMNAYENLNKRLDLLKSCERDYKYLDSIFDICRKYDEDVKDDFLCISVIQTCADVVPLWGLLPSAKVKQYSHNLNINTKEPITDKSFSGEQLRSYQKQLASSLYATRNSIVHAKSNYASNGTEFTSSEMNEANKIMEIIASSIIQWNDRQPDIYRIKEG